MYGIADFLYLVVFVLTFWNFLCFLFFIPWITFRKGNIFFTISFFIHFFAKDKHNFLFLALNCWFSISLVLLYMLNNSSPLSPSQQSFGLFLNPLCFFLTGYYAKQLQIVLYEILIKCKNVFLLNRLQLEQSTLFLLTGYFERTLLVVFDWNSK